MAQEVQKLTQTQQVLHDCGIFLADVVFTLRGRQLPGAGARAATPAELAQRASRLIERIKQELNRKREE